MKKQPSKKTGAGFNRGASKQDYATPPEFMAAVAKRFGPHSFDLAASEHNAKHANFFTLADDSLRQEWHKLPGLLWLNPPFDNIAPWAEKCQAEARQGARILFLTPASVGANWFAECVHRQALILAVRPRLSFDGLMPYPKDITLACYGFGVGFDTWKWK